MNRRESQRVTKWAESNREELLERMARALPADGAREMLDGRPRTWSRSGEGLKRYPLKGHLAANVPILNDLPACTSGRALPRLQLSTLFQPEISQHAFNHRPAVRQHQRRPGKRILLRRLGGRTAERAAKICLAAWKKNSYSPEAGLRDPTVLSRRDREPVCVFSQ
jgi:hypothetical protein